MAYTVKIRAVPNASKTQVCGWHGDAVKVKLQAVPEGGRANEELIRFLAEALGLPRRAITLVTGDTSRDKRISVEGVDEAAFRAKFGL